MPLKSDALKNKVCLVSGSNRGIGLGIIKTFAASGGIVYANARKSGSLDDISRELNEKFSGKIIPLYFDVTETQAAKKALLTIKKESRHLDVLVNNAGVMEDALIGMITKEQIDATFSVNVFAMIELIQLAAKIMVRQNSGSIINITSIMGICGNEGQLVYSASKGAVIALTKAAAKELASKQIRVNAIAPGVIDTDLIENLSEEKRKEKTENIAMGRVGTAQDIASACLYLASDLSTYVTGQVLGVDGGAVV